MSVETLQQVLPTEFHNQLMYCIFQLMRDFMINEQVGLPTNDIAPEELVEWMVQVGWSKQNIASHFKVSRQTIYNWTKHLQQDSSDTTIFPILKNIYEQSGRLYGAGMMQGALTARGYKVGINRIKNILRNLDPVGAQIRLHSVIKRRVYKVAGPMSLIHIDGNHRLIRWKIVIHGGKLWFNVGIDGYSRFITFLQASTNNRSDTVLNIFLQSIQKYGIPSRVRGDYGIENYGVCDFMESTLGFNRGSYIAGRSVHNVRIERLWRDVFEK